MEYQIINGEVLSQEDAKIPTNDLGMLRGYAIFDYFRVLEGKPVFCDDHLSRLFHSLDVMDLELTYSMEELKEMIAELIAKNEASEAGFRILVTGGFAEDGYTPKSPNLFMMMHALPRYDPTVSEKGSKLLTSQFQRVMPSVKTTIYVQSIHFAKKMKKEGAIEVLYHWDGNITECSRSNIFFVDKDDTIITPKHGVLKGITRKHTLEIAKGKYKVEMRPVHMDEIPSMKEIFITSTTKAVMPIVQIDDMVIGDGKPGPVSLDLAKRFQKVLKNYLINA